MSFRPIVGDAPAAAVADFPEKNRLEPPQGERWGGGGVSVLVCH